MSHLQNMRFAEYATSGAFNLTLARNQVAGLAMIEGGSRGYSMSESALERKGLIEAVPAPTHGNRDQFEFRPTLAGLLCLGLLREAGLTNGQPDPVAAELSALRTEIAQRRLEAAESSELAWSAMARMEEAERELARVQCDLSLARSGIKLKPEFSEHRAAYARPVVRRRDLHPEMSNADLKASIQGVPA